MVISYKRLRGDDAAPGSATAYRITVRQLEALVGASPPSPLSTPLLPPLLRTAAAAAAASPASPASPQLKATRTLGGPPPFKPCRKRTRSSAPQVRLSEALARLNLCEEVNRDHVKEVGCDAGIVVLWEYQEKCLGALWGVGCVVAKVTGGQQGPRQVRWAAVGCWLNVQFYGQGALARTRIRIDSCVHLCAWLSMCVQASRLAKHSCRPPSLTHARTCVLHPPCACRRTAW